MRAALKLTEPDEDHHGHPEDDAASGRDNVGPSTEHALHAELDRCLEF